MSQYFFGLHSGHLVARADKIAEANGAEHINYTDPRGERRGWFACPNRGAPFDGAIARAVMDAINAEGGIDSLRRKR